MTFYEQPFYDDDVIMTSQGRFQIFLTPPVHVPYFNLSTLKVSKLYLKKCRSRPLHQFVGYITIYHYLSLSISRKTLRVARSTTIQSQGGGHFIVGLQDIRVCTYYLYYVYRLDECMIWSISVLLYVFSAYNVLTFGSKHYNVLLRHSTC